jgi:uncharacterized Zn ribbon protein
MANQRSLSELIEQAETAHQDKFGNPLYSYSKINYPYQNNGNWEINCIRHSTTFEQNFRKHLSGQTGCKECVSEKKSAKGREERTEKFIKRAQELHVREDGKPFYNYSKVDYVSNHQKVIINCPVERHGDFPMTPGNHTHKANPQGCPKCAGRYQRTREEFIMEAQKKHSDSDGKPLYDYSEINYIDTTTHVSMYCAKHNKTFLQTPAKHLSGQKCPDCAKEIVAQKNTMSKEEFIEAAMRVHRDAKGNPRYDYSQVVYINNHTNITIICPHHGPFSQSPTVHKDGKSGCNSCRSSKGEQIIAEYLRENKIPFEAQYTFSDCMHKRPLPFDFKIEWNGKPALIEYHGEPHFRPVKYSKNDELSESRFRDIQTRDKVKKQYAAKREIPLIELTYKQDYYQLRSALDQLFSPSVGNKI